MIERLKYRTMVEDTDLLDLVAVKLNEVIDELNRQQQHITNVGEAVSLLEQAKESAKKEETPRRGEVLLTISKNGRDYVQLSDYLKCSNLAVEAYKKHLVEKLEEVSDMEDDYRGVGLDYAIKLIDETF